MKAPKPSDFQARVAGLRRPLALVSLVLFVAVTAYALIGIQPTMDPTLEVVRWAVFVLVAAALIGVVVTSKEDGNDLVPFLVSSASALFLVVLFAASMFPNLVVATVGENITIATAASSDLALGWMTGITCIGLPLVLIYHVIIYRTFRGRLTDEDLQEY